MENNVAQDPVQEPVPVPNSPQTKNKVLLPILIGISGLVFLSAVSFLGYRNWILQKEVQSLRTQSVPSKTVSNKAVETDAYSDPLGKYSFEYPKGLYPKVENEWITFYLDQYYADSNDECKKNKQGTLEYPCGFGGLVFTVFADPNSKKIETEILSNPTKVEQFTDSQNRNWKIGPQIPWTGSSFNMIGVDATTTINSQTVHIQVVRPTYQYFFNGDVVKAILSSFELK